MPKKILIIDNNELNIAFLTDLLETNGYQTYASDKGAKTIENIAVFEPDMIITEFKLPDISAETVISQIKNNHKLKDIPLIVLTAYALPDELEKIAALNPNELITKPIDISLLIHKIKKYLE